MRHPRPADRRILAAVSGLALVVQLVPNALGGYGYESFSYLRTERDVTFFAE